MWECKILSRLISTVIRKNYDVQRIRESHFLNIKNIIFQRIKGTRFPRVHEQKIYNL